MNQRLISQLLLQHRMGGALRSSITRRTGTSSNGASFHWNYPNYMNTATATIRWYQVSPLVLDKDQQADAAVPLPLASEPGAEEDYVARHKKGLSDPSIPEYQNPLHHVIDESKEKIFEEDYGPGEVMPEVPLPPLSDDPNDIGAPPHLHALAEEIVNLTMLEMTELTSKLQEHFGIDDSMYSSGSGETSSAKEEEVAKVEEKVIFDLKLEGFDPKAKIKVIKEVRAITGLGLKEAKELVEGAPKVIQKGIKKEEAEKLKEVLVAAGAIIEIV